MKYLKYFIQYVELPTKVASVLPFIFAACYYLFYLEPRNGLNYINFIIFFVAMLCFDMATTSINHYIAFTREKNSPSLYDETIIKEMNKLNITMKNNRYITYSLIFVATMLGLILVYRSNIGVLLLGMLCFLIGIAYSYGPKPIAYGPLGEVFSGATMGVILPVIVIFTQYDHLPFELNPLIALIFFPFAFYIANILLANNICDLKKDESNNRFTLTHYLGQTLAIKGLYLSNVIGIIFILISIYLNFLTSYWYLLSVLTLIPITLNVFKFKVKLSKQESFPFIVKNFILFSFAYLILLLIFK